MNGADYTDALNKALFLKYVAKRRMSWYQFVDGTIGSGSSFELGCLDYFYDRLPVTMIAISASVLHFDEDQYSNPFEFDGFRSYKQREEEGESIKHQMVTPQTNYVALGVGKHAWWVPTRAL
ncbi:hypothetical protein AAF712_015830 [Marasmius tenuissimus]|uniref:Uncharacterized protein n=1 Tax=Marasmius tenuissimus TaxID=585030 RepID=A0ABR2Z773_9AGAR